MDLDAATSEVKNALSSQSMMQQSGRGSKKPHRSEAIERETSFKTTGSDYNRDTFINTGDTAVVQKID